MIHRFGRWIKAKTEGLRVADPSGEADDAAGPGGRRVLRPAVIAGAVTKRAY